VTVAVVALGKTPAGRKLRVSAKLHYGRNADADRAVSRESNMVAEPPFPCVSTG
jgi:hypothetical protein